MKKFFKVSILVIICLGLVGTIPLSAKERSITFWMQRYGGDPKNEENLMNGLTAKFKKQTGITVNVVYNDWGQALTKYTLACTGGEAPDAADTFFLQSFVKMGGDKYGPIKLNDLARQIGMDRYYQGIIHEVKVGKDFYAIPWRADTRILAYNKDFFAEAGIAAPPKTWDELVALAKKLTKTDSNGSISRAGLIWACDNARFDQTWFAVIAQAGGKVFSDDMSKPIFDSPQGIESLQFMQDMVYKYKIMPKSVIDPSYRSQQEFMAGRAAMMAGVTADFMVMLEKNAPQMKGKIVGAVMPSKLGKGASSIGFAAPVVVYKTSKDIDAAKKWVKFFTATANQVNCSKELSLLNASKDVMKNKYFAQDPWLSVFAKQFEKTQMGDMPLANWSQIDAWPGGPLPELTSSIMAGKDINDSVKTAIDRINKIFAENK